MENSVQHPAGPIAVLTGDIVQSSRLSPVQLDMAMQTLDRAAGEIRRWEPGLLLGPPDFFRGDSWQLALSQPARFLRAAVFLRGRLLGMDEPADTRVAIGLGGVDRLDPRISRSVGEAFTLSGHTLDAMGRRRDLDIGVNAEALGWAPPLLALCGTVVGRWKPKQAQIACAALDPTGPTQKEIAAQFGMAQQSVSNAYVSSGLNGVLKAVEFVERVPWADVLGEAA